MDFQWVAIALGDVVWIGVAFGLGLVARSVGLPPLVGYLAAGFLLAAQGIANDMLLGKVADLGITLLLFTVGLKLNLRTLARPEVWAVTGLHMAIISSVFGLAVWGLALFGASYLSGTGLKSALLIAFAMSFSSTVLAVKVFEEKGEMRSVHGRIAIGILIMQDVAAVAFLAISTGKLPSAWALSLLLLVPLRPVLRLLLRRVGHGELLILYGFLLALGGAELFETVGMKGDLGALVLGALLATDERSDELAKSMLGFKDLFLLGFFLSIGLTGQPTMATVLIGALITPLIFIKSALFFALLTRFKLRARTSVLASLSLTNFSEFGLIVAAIGAQNGWIDEAWLIILSVALALSFTIAAALNKHSQALYANRRDSWERFQRPQRLAGDRSIDLGGARIAIFGMGGIGTGAYDALSRRYGDAVIGIDNDPVTVGRHREAGRNVHVGDPTDLDFWERVKSPRSLDMVMLALPAVSANLQVLERLWEIAFPGRVAATGKFPDEIEALRKAGATTAFNIYNEAGAGFASHVVEEIALPATD